MFWAARVLHWCVQPVFALFGNIGQPFEFASCWGLIIAIINLERGIPSKLESSARVDYVPALCTHRPSLLPIE